MTEKSTDKTALDRVCLISEADLATRSASGDFDPLHPIFFRTEGADPFTYANRFCQMKLTESGTVRLTRLGEPERFPEEWEALFLAVTGWKSLTDIRIYDFGFAAPPVAVALTTYGRVQLHGGFADFLPARAWQGVRQMYWDVDGFGALCEDDTFLAVGSLAALSGTGEIEEIACSALPHHCSPIAYLLQKNGTVLLFDRKNHTVTRPRERVQQISLVKYYPNGVSTWVALSKITGRFLCSEPRDSISADFFGGEYTDIIAPNRYRQKIRSIAAVPRKYLAVLYENGYLRIFGAGYNSGDILCEEVQEMELSGNELIVYLPSDLSYAPAIEFEEGEGDIADAQCSITLGAPVNLAGALRELRRRIDTWQEREHSATPPRKKILTTYRNRCYIYFLLEDGTVRAELLTHTGHSGNGENAVSEWKNVASIVPGRFQTLALCRDGSVLTAGRGYGEPYRCGDWQNIIALRQSGGMAAGLRANGTVAALQADTNRPIKGVEDWREITAIELGEDFIVGLRRDGTVCIAGLEGQDEQEEQVLPEVGGWREITKLAVAAETVAGLTRRGEVLTAGQSRYMRFEGMENRRDIRDLLSFQNGGCAFFGLTEDGSLLLSGRWNPSAFSYEDCLDHEKWSHLRRIWQDGYYLLGEREDGSIIYESTPTEKAGDPPCDDHITDWTTVTDEIIGGAFLLAIREDGTVAWEGAHRRPNKLRITQRWRGIEKVLLWSIGKQRSNALGVDREGRLWSDMVASGFDAPAKQRAIDAFFGQFTGVRRIFIFQPFLLVLHGESLSFLLLQGESLQRIDLPAVGDVFLAEEGKTAVVTFLDGAVRSFGHTLYSSTVEEASTIVKYYGDRSDFSEDDPDGDPFHHFEGILGVSPDGRPFVLSPANAREKEDFYSVQDLLYFDTIDTAIDIEPMGDLLLADGSCRSKRGDLFAKWVGIRQLSSCFTHAVGVTTFNTVVVRGDGEYGSCSVDAYMGIAQAFSLPHATVLLLDNGTLVSLCEKLSETPYEPLPVTKDVRLLAKTAGHFAILCRDGTLWSCEAQAFADKIRWRGSSEYYTRPWGPWKKVCGDAYQMTVTGECIRVWRRDKSFSYMEPTLEQNALTGYEPTLD